MLVHTRARVTRQVPVDTGLWVADQIKKGMLNVQVHDLARRITAGLVEEHINPQISAISEMKAIANFVKKHVRYTRDPWGVELVYGPMAALERVAHPGQAVLRTKRTWGEDCDGFAVFTGALLASIGLQVRVALVGYRHMVGWNHIFVLAKLPGSQEWVTLDTSMKHKARYYLKFASRSYIIPVNERPL